MRVAPLRIAAAGTVVALLTFGLAGCGGGAKASDEASGGVVTITAGNLPSEQSPDERKTFLGVISAFEKDNPNIKIKPEETSYDPQTFAALVAGGTMPTVMDAPFTDTQALIARHQIKDVTSEFKADPTLAKINPTLMSSATDKEGHVYGVPSTAYSMAVVVNRAVFKKAGLDPSKPFATWDDLRAAAKTISDKTDAAGLGVMTKDNQGGWGLTAMSYAFGGKVEKTSGDTTKATVDNQGTTQALEFLQKMRWQDNSLGTNFLTSQDDLLNGLAAGQYGMLLAGSDAYWSMVISRKFPAQDFGLLPMPQDSDGLGTLGGGTYMVIRPDATKAQTDAAMKWAAYKFQRFTDKDAAIKAAKTDAAAGYPVPQMGVPMVGAKAYKAYLGYVKDYINVPMDNIAPYNATVDTMPLVPEPAIAAQQVYGALDPVVQAVLTKRNENVSSLLKNAQSTVAGIVSAQS